MHHTILAVDVGHGHLKAVHHPAPGVQRRITYPSFALPTSTRALDENCITSGLKVMSVSTGNARFLVGEDVEMLTRPTDERNLDEAYSMSDSHLALIRGTLSRAGYSNLDLLVVGLPLTTLESNAKRLRERLAGEHEVPPFADHFTKELTSRVTVKRVEVLAQPLGALFSAIASDNNLKSSRVLTLDLGYNTLDAVTSQGMRPLPKRSGAVQGGVSAYIEEMQKSVEEEVRKAIPRLNGQYRVPAQLYEQALRTQPPRNISLSVGTVNLEKHIGAAAARLEKDLAKVLTIVGSPADISAFVLAGGGASLLRPILETNYPEIRQIVTIEDPQFAIARGYLLFGQALIAQPAHHA
jgi:plasmid segregation protein ParM